jgi:S-adenosylmethionine:tRNA ribosyltransferase-isomerase
MHPRELSIDEVTYTLPEDRIAQQPLAERDASRLLVLRGEAITDHHFRDLPDLLPPDSLLLLNNTRVLHARLHFRRATGAHIEVLCTGPADGGSVEPALQHKGRVEWKALLGNARKWALGERLVQEGEGSVLVAERTGQEQVLFSWRPEELTFAEVLERAGRVPLPPYMHRPDEEDDRTRYNTVIARHDGSVAAPTASLHFTPEVLARAQERGIRMAEVTLHVGAGTFLPVKSARMEGHDMHREEVHFPLEALYALREQLGHGPVVPVGTTALRTVESIYWHGEAILNGRAGSQLDIGQWDPYGEGAGVASAAAALDAVIAQVQSGGTGSCSGSTRLLIAPGYRFRFADALVTNFHQPRSTLLLLVQAFVGTAWRKAYTHALDTGYPFLSYGDASLLFRQEAVEAGGGG